MQIAKIKEIKMNDFYFINGKVVLADKVLNGASVKVKDGKIVEILESGETSEDLPKIDLKGKYLMPGFVEVHVHGGGGYDVMDGSPEAIEEVVDAHLHHGTTTICPTTMSEEFSVILKTFDIYREVLKRKKTKAYLAGLHLEGPFISPAMAGAQRKDLIIPPTDYHINCLKENSDIIARISCAPDVDNVINMAKTLIPYGISFSMGHTSATYEQAEEAFEAGFESVTHIYSATSGFHKVNQKVHIGVTQAGYGIDGLYVEAIGDGCHVPKELIRLLVKFKGADYVCLVTDAMRATGTDVTESYLGKKVPENRVIIDDGVAKLPDKSFFAGSIGTLDRAVAFAITKANISIPDAVKMVSLTPATLLKLNDRKGSIAVGKDADFVIMNEEFKLENVYVNGEMVV